MCFLSCIVNAAHMWNKSTGRSTSDVIYCSCLCILRNVLRKETGDKWSPPQTITRDFQEPSHSLLKQKASSVTECLNAHHGGTRGQSHFNSSTRGHKYCLCAHEKIMKINTICISCFIVFDADFPQWPCFYWRSTTTLRDTVTMFDVCYDNTWCLTGAKPHTILPFISTVVFNIRNGKACFVTSVPTFVFYW